MAKAKKKTTKKRAAKHPRKAPRKTKRKATKRSARKTASGTCKVVTVCGKRRRLCFKKKGNRIVISSNTAA